MVQPDEIAQGSLVDVLLAPLKKAYVDIACPVNNLTETVELSAPPDVFDIGSKYDWSVNIRTRDAFLGTIRGRPKF
jgi:hypothetical protein